ncbi:hypothetical protein S21ZY_023 [Pseudomonas phage ZY21]|nr:hypothetical protein S21ZY_023 [Pseudomonas phage ZY21]
MMERQISRIQAENEIRLIQTNMLTQTPQSKEQLQRVTDHVGRLTLEIGEKVTIRRNAIVAPEQNASAKFMKLIGGG